MTTIQIVKLVNFSSHYGKRVTQKYAPAAKYHYDSMSFYCFCCTHQNAAMFYQSVTNTVKKLHDISTEHKKGVSCYRSFKQ